MNYTKIYINFLVCFAFVMVAFPTLIGLFGVLSFIMLIWGIVTKELKYKYSTIHILFLLLYIMYLIGVVYTKNEELAMKYLEYKLSWVLFPVFFSFRLSSIKTMFPKVVLGLVAGTFAIVLMGVINSIACYLNGGDGACFLTVSISPIHHPTYLVVYAIFAVSASWIGYIKKWKWFLLKWIIPYSILMIGVSFLSLSLAGILFLMLLIGLSILLIVFKYFGKPASILILCLLPFVGYLTVNYVPQIEGEWNGAKWYADQYAKNPEEFVRVTEFPMSGSEQRLIMWTVAYQELMEHPLGAGTGNVDEVLGNRLRNLNQSELANLKLNPHNQFLQTGVEVGLFGLLVLLLIIGYTIYFAAKNKNWILLILVLNLVFNCLFESMLQRQSGIVFYTFWICLLIYTEVNTREIIEQNK